MPTIVHFEVPVDDIGRARDFYARLFGWEIKKVSEMDYWMITTSGEKPVNGGMMRRQEAQQTIINYVDVPSVSEYAMKIEKLGGKIIVPRMAVPGMGYFAVGLDTENNPFGIWEENKEA